MLIRLDWNGYMERWIVKKPHGSNVYEIPDCDNVNALFPGLDKEEKNYFRITTEKVSDDDQDM